MLEHPRINRSISGLQSTSGNTGAVILSAAKDPL